MTDSSSSSRPLLFCHAGAPGSFMRRLVAVFHDPVRNEGIEMSQSGGRSYALHSEMEHFYRSFVPDGECVDIISDKLTC